MRHCRPFGGPEPDSPDGANRPAHSVDRAEIERRSATYFVSARTLWDRRSWVVRLSVCRLSLCQWAVSVVGSTAERGPRKT